jgi:hypothetical protein
MTRFTHACIKARLISVLPLTQALFFCSRFLDDLTVVTVRDALAVSAAVTRAEAAIREYLELCEIVGGVFLVPASSVEA